MTPPGKLDKPLPTVFIAHGGGPWPFVEDMAPMFEGLSRYLKALPSQLNAKPRAILVISGHWEEDQFTVAGNPRPPMIYDYYGFPEHTYKIKYDAPGSPALAARVQALLTEAQIPSRIDLARGFDHGTFVPLAVSYPQADMPIVQLSLRKDLDPAAHLALGRALAPLRHEGILILGSGMSYHNLRAFGERGKKPSEEFDAWLSEVLATRDPFERNRKLSRWANAPSARFAHPREEHLIPLLVAAGAAEEDLAVKTYDDELLGVRVSGFQFG